MKTGFYTYKNHSDGLCQYFTKKAAIRAAEKSKWETHETPCVYSPTGRVVWIKP